MIDQIAIGVFGFLAVLLSQQRNLAWQRWAPILGLMAQPFWFYATFTAEQWGIFALSFFYTWAWLVGLRNHWFGG